MLKKNIKKIMIFFHNLKLGNKLFLFYALFILIPMTSIGMLSYAITKDALQNKTKQYLQSKVESNSKEIDNELVKYTKGLSTMIFNGTIDDIFSSSYTNNDSERHNAIFRLRSIIFDTMSTDLEENVVQFYTNNISMIDNSYIRNFDEIKYKISAEGLKLLQQSKIIYFVNDFENRNGKKERYIGIAAKKYGLENMEQCIINVNIPISKIEPYLNISDISKSGWTCYGEITDNNNNGEDQWFAEWNLNKGINPQIREEINRKSNNLILSDDSLVIFRQSRISSLYMVASIPYKDMYRDVNKILALTVIIMVVFTIILLPISYEVSRYLTRRLYDFVERLESRDQDNTDIIMDNGNDEVSNLIRKFNQIIIKNNMLLEERYIKELQMGEMENKLLQVSLNHNIMELNLLQSQINPHFIYNIFSSIKIAIIANKDREKIDELLDSVVRFYRLSLNNGRTFVKVSQEIEITREYINIQNFINNNKINAIFEIDENIDDFWCIKFLLQPVVENSIYHGLLPREDNCILMVSCEIDSEYIVFTVSDNGIGFKEEDRSDSSNTGGFGLKNVRERIELFYKENGKTTISSSIGQGTDVQIKVPVKTYYDIRSFD